MQASIEKLEELKIKKPLIRIEFMKNIPIYRLEKQFGVRRQTIYGWIHAEKWEEEREKIATNVRQKANIDLEEEKERSIKLIKAVESKFANELQSNEGIPKSTAQFAQIQRVKWEILMPKTISQYNFLKQENNNGPTYTFQIIEPDDNTNTMETQSQTKDSL